MSDTDNAIFGDGATPPPVAPLQKGRDDGESVANVPPAIGTGISNSAPLITDPIHPSKKKFVFPAHLLPAAQGNHVPDAPQIQPGALVDDGDAPAKQPVDLALAVDTQGLAEIVATDGSAESQDEAIERLARMPKPNYDRVRKLHAKNLGLQLKTLDDLVKDARHEQGDAARLPFPVVEPYPHPINPALVLDEVADIIKRYVVLGNEQADAVALWIVFTWFIDDALVAAILIITAPERACGKSQLLELIGRMVARPLSAASSSASFLFRAIEAWSPTLLIDEADCFIRENEELKGLVNAGHTRANAFVGRTVSVGDGHEPRLFIVWGAKAFAGIALDKHLPDATMSRGIIVVMGRKMAHETVERLRHAATDLFATVASKLARFANDYSDQVRSARPLLPDELSDRDQDNWEVLMAIAQCAGSVWVARATAAALKLSGAGDSVISTGNELLSDIRDVFLARGVFKMSSADLIAALVADVERPWATYNHGKPFSPRQLAKLLAAYGIKPKTVRQKFGTPKGYDAGQFEEVFARYLAAPADVPPQHNGSFDSVTELDEFEADKPWRGPVVHSNHEF